MQIAPMLSRFTRVIAAFAVRLLAVTLLFAMPRTATASAPLKENSQPSSTAQKLYQAAQNDLLQLRILIRNGRAQATVGSGFLIGRGNLVVTNYHVVAQIALQPKTYTGEYLDSKGRSGTVELLAVDALHDLAVVRIDRRGNGFFQLPAKPATLRKGQYLYSLGNPLDLGFTISEGSYNGVMHRSFYDQLLFTGPINAGMSGGPCIAADGRLAGVNVSKRTDGELVSFIVPVKYVQELLRAASAVQTPPRDFSETVGQQLLGHQRVMMDRILAEPLTIKTLGKYRVPVRESDQMRCWGDSPEQPKKLYSREKISCDMETSIFVSAGLKTGHMSMSHEFTRSAGLGPLRFSQVVAESLKNEEFGNHKSKNLTSPACSEQFLTNGKLSMRAVLCVRAYKKFAGLYNFALLTDTTDESQLNLKSRLDVRGVSYENGLRITRTFLEAIDKENKP